MDNFTLFDSLVNTTFYTDDYDENYEVMKNDKDGDNKSMEYEDICIVVIYLAFCFLGIIGNGVVIWFGIFRMKKTVNVVFFLSLAIADFSFALLISLIIITQIILEYWPLEKLTLKVFGVLLSLNMLVSILQITVISVDRCICVVFPVWCHNHRRPRLALIIVLIIWIISFLLAFSYLLIFELSDICKTCILTLDESSQMKRTVLNFVFFFFLPFVIIVFCYIVIALHLRKKRIFTSPKPFKTIVVIIIAFFVFWFPIRLFDFLITFEGINLNFYVLFYGAVVSIALAIMNSCINPILYVFIGRDFKKNFCGSFQATLEKAFIEKDELDSVKQERHVAHSTLHQVSEEEVAI